jgi:hypothetical protein
MDAENAVAALPYIDRELDAEGMREHVRQLIEQEMRSFRPSRDYVAHIPVPDLALEVRALTSHCGEAPRRAQWSLGAAACTSHPHACPPSPSHARPPHRAGYSPPTVGDDAHQ